MYSIIEFCRKSWSLHTVSPTNLREDHSKPIKEPGFGTLYVVTAVNADSTVLNPDAVAHKFSTLSTNRTKG